MLLRYLVKEKDVALTPEDVDFISDLIVGNNDAFIGSSSKKLPMFINPYRGVDVRHH